MLEEDNIFHAGKRAVNFADAFQTENTITVSPQTRTEVGTQLQAQLQEQTDASSTMTTIYLSICPIILWTVGAPHDVTTNLRLSSAFLTVSLSPKPVHSQMLSSHRFLCLPLLLPSCTVPWRNVLARLKDLVMCPYHCSLRCFTMVARFCFEPLRS